MYILQENVLCVRARNWPSVLLGIVGVFFFDSIPLHAGPNGATPWAVIKCKFSDQPQEPAFDTAFFTGSSGMAGYWRDVSYQNIKLDGTTINGWYTLPFTLADGSQKSRSQLIDACIGAATDVDFSKYYGIIAMLNVSVGSPGASGRRVLIGPLGPTTYSISFLAHEMGHAYGLDHSFDDSGTVYDPLNDGRSGAYGDSFDIMSFRNFGGWNPNPMFTGTYLESGPGLNAPNLDKLGWMPADRVFTWTGTAATITLAALNRPLASGYLMAKIPLDSLDPNHYFTVELRRKVDWDQGIPRDVVLIHEVKNGLFYLTRGGGSERLPGDTYFTSRAAISVLSFDPNLATAVINIGRSSVYVNSASLCQFGNGTSGFPYCRVADGVADAASGNIPSDGTVYIAGGHYNEPMFINKKVKLQNWSDLGMNLGPVVIGSH